MIGGSSFPPLHDSNQGCLKKKVITDNSVDLHEMTYYETHLTVGSALFSIGLIDLFCYRLP